MLSSQSYGGAISFGRGRFMQDCRMERDHHQLVQSLSYCQILRMSTSMPDIDTLEEGGSNYDSVTRRVHQPLHMMSSMTSRPSGPSLLMAPMFPSDEEASLGPTSSIHREDEPAAFPEYDGVTEFLSVGTHASAVCSSVAIIPADGVLQEVGCELAELSNTASRNSTVRTCTLCGTSKTPLWRSGPMGAKSLCNACGIRSRKVKRSKMEASMNGDSGQQQLHKNIITKAKRKRDDMRSASRLRAPKCRTSHGLAAMRTSHVKECEQHLEVVKRTKKRDMKQAQSYSPALTDQSFSCVTSGGSSTPYSSPVSSDEIRKPSPSSMRLQGVMEMCSEIEGRSLHRRLHHHPLDGSFSKDEEQAAFLLMALSSGLVLRSNFPQ